MLRCGPGDAAIARRVFEAALAESSSGDALANYLKTLELAPEFAERVRGATREERFTGGSVPNFFRKPFGPGWALVGDAGYNRDPITAQGISDAFRDAELCSTAMEETFSGRRSYEDAMSADQMTRDTQVLPIYGEVVPGLVEVEVAVPRLSSTIW